jgi:pantothenate kinase type III
MTNAAFELCTLNIGNTCSSLMGWRPAKKSRSCGTDIPVCLLAKWKTGCRSPSKVLTVARACAAAGTPVLLASVVPDYAKELTALLRNLGCDVVRFRKDIKPSIGIVPQPARRVGDDRIAGALGALALDSRRPWVVVDAGTAMTINAVLPARKGRLPRFEGGLIIPGFELSLLAMAAGTAQLPQTGVGRLVRSRNACIGRNTQEAMRLGVYHAQIAAAIALTGMQVKVLGKKARVALTGGLSEDPGFYWAFARAFSRRAVAHPHLVHLGLYSCWRETL